MLCTAHMSLRTKPTCIAVKHNLHGNLATFDVRLLPIGLDTVLACNHMSVA